MHGMKYFEGLNFFFTKNQKERMWDVACVVTRAFNNTKWEERAQNGYFLFPTPSFPTLHTSTILDKKYYLNLKLLNNYRDF